MMLHPLVDHVIWSSKASPQSMSFLLTADFDKILTQDKIRNRHKVMVSACPLCVHTSEDVDHLHLHCPFSLSIWSSTLSLFDV